MAQFIGYLQGRRGRVSRIGHKTTGLWAKVCGWNLGAHVEVYHEEGEDMVSVSLTRGSAGEFICEIFRGTLEDAIRKGKTIEKMRLANHNLRMARAVPTINRIGEEGP